MFSLTAILPPDSAIHSSIYITHRFIPEEYLWNKISDRDKLDNFLSLIAPRKRFITFKLLFLISETMVLTVCIGNGNARICHFILFLTIPSVYVTLIYVTSIVYSQLSPLDAHASGNVPDNTWWNFQMSFILLVQMKTWAVSCPKKTL